MLIPVFSDCAQKTTAVKTEIYYSSFSKDTARWITVDKMDDKLTRQESHKFSSISDSYINFQKRISKDNGKTWSDFIPIPLATQQLPGGGLVNYPGTYTFDPILNIQYQYMMRRQFPGKELYDYSNLAYIDHCLILENGVAKELKYESGPNFDEDNPFDSLYLRTNRAFMGHKIVLADDGTAFYPMSCFRREQANAVGQGGAVLMRRDVKTQQWTASNQQYIDPNISSRGLLELDLAILKNDHLLIICRGSNVLGRAHTTEPDSLQARKWFLTSNDGGKTISQARELTYDDGSRFYSPASIHTMIRSNKDGRLYWLANVTTTLPDGNSPRYPLYLFQIDEENVSVVKNSAILIDDRRSGDPEGVQLSNFSVIENPETLEFEIYLSKIGQDPDHLWNADVYKYTVTIGD